MSSQREKNILELIIDPLKGGSTPASDGEVFSVQKIPWLYRHPNQQLLEWRMKIKSVADYYQHQAERAQKESRQVEQLPATTTRLKTLARSYSQSSTEFKDLVARLAFNEPNDHRDAMLNQQAPGTLASFFEKTPRQQTVMAYQDTLFRDWVWGLDEIARQAQPLLPLLKNTKNWAVLGAGACGLPLHLHQALNPQSTLAIDINPVLLLPVQQLFQGHNFRCNEYPRIPRESKFVALEHEIVAPQKAPENFHLIFADAQNIEFKKNHLDVVITPWFIDIIPRAFRDLAAHINYALPKGGKWVNIGQLAFERNELGERLTADEIKEQLIANGFQIETFETHEIPYLHSPYSTMGRIDQILVFSAVKEKGTKKPARYEYLPVWLRELSTPVPQTPEMHALVVKSEIFGRALRYVDGQRNFDQIAEAFAHDFKMDVVSAREALHVFFVNIYEQHIFREF